MRQVRFVFFAVFVLAALGLGFTAAPAYAQDNSSVTGVVTDPSGAVVADATVTLSNDSIGFSATKQTNGIGVYEFSNVPASPNYSILVTKDGFATVSLNGITLNVGNKETRDVKLQVGDTKVSIEVTASVAETINSTDDSIGSNIDGDRIQDLPNDFVNNAANYLSLAPGVTPTGEVTGSRSDQTNITLDGLDVNDQRGGFAFVTTVNTPLDSIQEFKVTSTGDDATYGHSAGGQLELVTKSGTNNFHGQAFEYNRVRAYTANDFFNNLNGVPNPQYIRNQFGGDLGGPIIKKKLFFFFSYNGLRSTTPEQNLDTVPMSQFYNGQLAYVNTLGNTVLSPTTGPNSITALDPAGVGPDISLLSFLQARPYPLPNNSGAGDSLNTSGYYFVSPVQDKDNTYIGRVDYQLNEKHRLFVRGTWDRSVDGGFSADGVQLFPNDPNPSASYVDHSRAWVAGDTWTISSNMTNQFSFGETDQVNAFVVNNAPTSPNSLSFFDGFFGSGQNVITNPYFGLNQQFPVVPVYQGRDNFTWVKGKHVMQFGGLISPVIFKSGNLTDTNTYDIGIGGFLTGLTAAQRPSDFNGDPSEWDRLFAIELGRYASISSGYNYDPSGNPTPQGVVAKRDYHSTQYEFYAQDSWTVRPDFTITYGLRWNFHNPLSEVNGFEAVQNQTPDSIFNVRQANAAAGVSGNDAAPLLTYGLGGPKNHGPGYYKPAYNDFAPRIGLAWAPSATEGWLAKLFGNRKSSIRAGFGVDFDNNLVGTGFELDETSFLFSNTPAENFGNIATDPRFACSSSSCTGTALSASLPSPVPAGTSPRPTFQPNVFQGVPYGFFDGGFGEGSMFNFDPNYRTPYEMHFSLGIQRELPGNWLIEADYVGKLGRKLEALGDPAQTLNFKDAASGQALYSAYGAVQQQLNAGTSIFSLPAQPWFENQMGAALAQNGLNCPTASNIYFGVTLANCTQFAVGLAGFYFQDGDTSSMIQTLADNHFFSGSVFQGLLLPNVGLLAQDGAAGYIGNWGNSNYNALVIRVNHRTSHDLFVSFNYTYSHSIDNDSGVQNNLIDFSTSEICDLRNLRACRGSSDFDLRHLVSGSFDYGLPFGKGKSIGHDSNSVLDEVIGGWHVSGIVSARSGYPFKIDSGAFTIDFTQTQPGVFLGPKSAVAPGIHGVSQGAGVPATIEYFKNENNALNAFGPPVAGGPGNRNLVTGPGLWNVDLALLKDFKLPFGETQKLQFRCDAINVFNHVNFSSPGGTNSLLINPAQFGTITSDVNGPRILQLGLRYMF